jgi:hypothetical protein
VDCLNDGSGNAGPRLHAAPAGPSQASTRELTR